MERKTGLTAAALAALAMAGCAHDRAATGGSAAVGATSGPAVVSAKKGECWGVNACKGQGSCGGPEGGGHECAGQNSCKGKGWLSLTRADCDARHGDFKAQ